MPITWRSVLDWKHPAGTIEKAAAQAKRCNYPFFLWNGRVYTVDLSDTGLTEANIR